MGPFPAPQKAYQSRKDIQDEKTIKTNKTEAIMKITKYSGRYFFIKLEIIKNTREMPIIENIFIIQTPFL